ncbi:MAG: Nif3-like dinuclear metal center hexameric protein [Phycisphaerales bacterium]|nr:Nif3-like dinuclear metal center hexameric protein [Phycisphaerae bacterium]NNF43154.1 Nif3-like dinuclear metal center hexameric protein [Phycisphaerales bacterium]NNM26002.1 Nif3-like dinuclear metal center hexameric protein [Phycisphaerales bacterium]
MNVTDVLAALESIAPLRYAAEWDNVGLLIGSPKWPATHLLLTIDLTERVLEEAIEHEVDMIVAYHPPIFRPIAAVTDASPTQRIALEAAAHRIAVYSPHTALDAAPGGVNDWLTRGVGDGDVRALEAQSELPESENHKVVTFCPADAVDELRKALAAVGAGQIGAYQLCSFEMEGTGTFLGGVGSNPTIGRRGVLERVPETRLEMVCPGPALGLVVLTLREFHPYEEPPIEIHRLEPRPERHIGMGRRVVLDRPCGLDQLVERLKHHLDVPQLRVAIGRDAPEQYQTIGLCAGAGGSLAPTAVTERCELYLTGEMRHHDVLAAQAAGCTIILAGHTNTERGYLPHLAERVSAETDGVRLTISRRDADPLRAM